MQKNINIGINYKSIIQPKYIIEMFVHEPNCTINGCFVKDIYISHYYTKSLEEWIEKIKRGTCSNECHRKYDEFFYVNQDMQQYYDSSMEQLEQSYIKGYKYDIRIMAHPSRKENVLKILSQLKMDESIVVYDDRGLDKADALYTAKKTWLSPISDPLVTHRIVLQDDTLLADNFLRKCNDIICTIPDNPVTLFNTLRKDSFEVKNKTSVYFTAPEVNGVCIIMPIQYIQPCWQWIDENPFCLCDDIMIDRYFSHIKKQIYTVVPCLVQHIGGNNSLISIHGKTPSYLNSPRISETFSSHAIGDFTILAQQPINEKRLKQNEWVTKRYEKLKQKYNL